MSVTPEQAAEVWASADCLIPAKAMAKALDQMAAAISADLAKLNPLLLCVMTGGVVTLGQLLPRLAFPLQVDYLHATRYDGDTQGGDDLRWLASPRISLSGRHVLVVDDILDEGLTLAGILAHCEDAGAASVRSAVLVKKLHDRCVPGLRADYCGESVPDRYVFGYGMDYHEYLRNADGIYAVAGQ